MSARLAVRAASLAAAALLATAPLLAQADRSHPPKPGPVKPLKLPPVERLKLSNGIGVVLVGMHEVPVVEVILVLRAGAVADPAGREGLAAMTADMLDEGAGGKDALALADAIDFLGATVGAGSAWDVSTVRLRVPVARLDEALSLMADVALRPDFPQAELQRLRKEALTDLLQARDEPGAIAARALAQAVFGPAHRYGKPQAGGAEQIAAFTVADLRAFHAARYVPSAATLVVVGDADRLGAAVAREGVRLLEGCVRCRAGAGVAGAPPAHEPLDLARRQEGGRAVLAAARPRGARVARCGLRPQPGDEHAARRLVHVAPQRQPARAARLRLRGELALPPQPHGRALPGGDGRADRQDRPRRSARCSRSSSGS